MEKNRSNSELLASLSKMNGELAYTLTNDYLFRALLQKNEEVLKGFLTAVLHLERDQAIRSVYITNPILLGEAIDEKTCILDVFLIMNNNTRVNIEMQVSRQDGYRNRTLLYLCRSYDKLKKGEAYEQLKPTIHISILDFIPQDGARKFYSENYLMDMRDHEIYSRNLSIIMIQLSEIERAENTERESGLYQWARLFKARTWEEMKEMAQENELMAKAVVTLKDLSEDDKIRLQCEARDRYEHDMASARAGGLREGIKVLILDNLEEGRSKDQIVEKLIRRFSLSPEHAEDYFKQYAQEEDMDRKGKEETR